MTPSPSLIFHPLVGILVQNQIVRFTAGFTASSSSLRPVILTLLVAYASATLCQFSNYVNTTSFWGIVLGVSSFHYPFVFWDRLIVRKWAFEDRRSIFPSIFGGEKKPKRNDEDDENVAKHVGGAAEATEDTFAPRAAFGQEVASTGRMVDTPWEAKNVAPFSASDPSYVPSFASMIARRILVICAVLVVRETVMEVEASMDPSYLTQSHVAFLTRLNEVTPKEVLVRLTVGVGTWSHSYCSQQILYNMGMITLACLKPQELRKLRPPFGPLSEAYTVRGYWG